jgi:hypothetical protein
MKDELEFENILAARSGVAGAESDLARLLSEIQGSPRAEKRTPSEALRDAVQKLRAAREQLRKLERVVCG